MTNKKRAFRLNVLGDFYVEEGCCTLCGVPSVTAPALFGGFEEDGSATDEQCWVAKQPGTPGELDAMLTTMDMQELECIRYCGTSATVLARVRSIAGTDLVDRREDVVRGGADGSD